MEYLDHHVLWWHWIVLGILLMAAEILAGTFIIVWFGVAAVIVGALLYFVHLSFSMQLFLWAVLSPLLTFVYWRWFRRHERAIPIGQSEGEYAGIQGRIVEVLGQGRYKAYFDLPVLGDRNWIVESIDKEPLDAGDPIHVVRVYGQIIKIAKGEN